MIVGLTGGIATGKSTITHRLKQDGYTIIDADEITALLYQTNTAIIQTIGQIFPETVIENKINRQLLAQIITDAPHLLTDLEAVIHPVIQQEIKKQLDIHHHETKPVILSAPVLFETGLNHFCDKVICLYTSVRHQWLRAQNRPGMTRTKFDMLIKRQWCNRQRMRQSDINISTFSSIQKTYTKVLKSIQKWEE